MGGYGLIRKYLLGEATEDTTPVKPKVSEKAFDKSGYTPTQVKKMKAAKSGTVLKAINNRRKAMDEIMGK
jgi:hypothetical protein